MSVSPRSNKGVRAQAPKNDNHISLGTVINGSGRRAKDFKFQLNNFRKHALVCGVTGSGKTNTCINLMEQLWLNNLPFLVIDTVKSEYRQFVVGSKILKDDTRIFSVGDEEMSSLRINPLEVIRGVRASAHRDALKAIFDGMFEMWAPMPQVLSQALDLVYVNRGWDLAQNKNLRLPNGINIGDQNCPPNIHPSIKDLYEIIGLLTDSFGYSERIVPDVKAALQIRLRDLLSGEKGKVISTRSSMPLELLYNKPVIIELDDIYSDNEKTFLVSVLLLFLSEFRKLSGLSGSLKHVVFLDDGHCLLKRRDSEKNSGNFKPNFVEFFIKILSEMRAYGEGIVVSAQCPAGLAPEILSNTNLKIVHRLVTTDDLDSVSGSTYLGETHRKKIVTLGEGEAIFYAENMRQPSYIKMRDASKRLKSPVKLKRSDLLVSKGMTKAGALIKPERHLGCDYCCDPTILSLATTVADDPLFRLTYNNYVLATMRDLGQFVNLRAHIVHQVQRILGRQEISVSVSSVTWCALCRATERYFDKKGAEHYWDYNQVREQQLEWLALLKLAFLPSDERQKIESSKIKTWQHEFVEMQKRNAGPLLACGPCTSKCLYRFEVSEIIRDPKVRSDFNASLNRDDQAPSESAAWFCRLLSQRIVGEKGDLDLAYCLAVHLISEQQLSNDAQLVLLHKIRIALENPLEGEMPDKPRSSGSEKSQ